jgi:hypothetical protein
LKQPLLIIGHTFPEPSTTAAGCRMMQLIELFSETGYTITFASTALASERSVNLERLHITTQAIQLNNASFDAFVSDLNPSVVVFDRYITEEQFGWRVAEHCPHALRILDTEDLHFLRKARETAVKAGIPVEEANLYTDIAKRELTSILRSDLSLLISEVELALLQNTFNIAPGILHYLPFLVDEVSEAATSNLYSFEERGGFVTIGNLLHAPNVDALLYLKKEIWPLIRKELPEALMLCYGSYAPQQILELHDEAEGFLIKGWAPKVSDVFLYGRVCLAPLRFGAGLKGKLLDAMVYGIPSVTTPIGAEGMHGTLPFAGSVTHDPIAFAKASVALYNNKINWLQAQQNGFQILAQGFQKSEYVSEFIEIISRLQKDLSKHRTDHFIGQVLQHQSLQSTKYLSKWIEAKNTSASRQASSKVCFEDSDEVRPDYRFRRDEEAD